MNNLAKIEQGTELLEKVVIGGDLSKLTAEERLLFYTQVCESLGLNALTRPFEYIVLNGKLTLYARKDCTEQLRNLRNVSVAILAADVIDGVYVVRAKATMGARFDESIGAVAIEGLKGDSKANAMMKAETKSKRRVTLSICGLGILDETEVETIPDAKLVAEKAQPVALGLASDEKKTEIRELAKKIYGDKNGGLKLADYIKKYKISNGNPMTARHAELILADLEKQKTEVDKDQPLQAFDEMGA